MNDFAIETRGLTKIYGSESSALTVLNDVSLTVANGERLAILGRSGSGKSTLLNLIGGLDVPTSGTITVAGSPLHSLTSEQRAEYRLRTVGIVFQAFHLVSSRTAVENVELPLIFAGHDRHERRRLACAALDAVGLSERRTHRPNTLSGGERQRVALARALVNRPRILLADEPTGNLDTQTAAQVIELMLTQVERDRTTLILVTHDEELAQRVANRVIRMKDGRILEPSS